MPEELEPRQRTRHTREPAPRPVGRWLHETTLS
jgi:hypothetical protein